MKRYLRVLSLFWRVAIAAELEYRINFVVAVISSVGGLAGSLFGLFLFYRTDYTLSGLVMGRSTSSSRRLYLITRNLCDLFSSQSEQDRTLRTGRHPRLCTAKTD